MDNLLLCQVALPSQLLVSDHALCLGSDSDSLTVDSRHLSRYCSEYRPCCGNGEWSYAKYKCSWKPSSQQGQVCSSSRSGMWNILEIAKRHSTALATCMALSSSAPRACAISISRWHPHLHRDPRHHHHHHHHHRHYRTHDRHLHLHQPERHHLVLDSTWPCIRVPAAAAASSPPQSLRGTRKDGLQLFEI